MLEKKIVPVKDVGVRNLIPTHGTDLTIMFSRNPAPNKIDGRVFRYDTLFGLFLLLVKQPVTTQ